MLNESTFCLILITSRSLITYVIPDFFKINWNRAQVSKSVFMFVLARLQ